ncbi:MAG: isoleucine--tRNA ligase [Verrucomicrobiota bacterium]|nr:isoleucine--tRNA ligase [Verrucomicrobiota bacterium]
MPRATQASRNLFARGERAMFKPISNKADFAAVERDVLAFWREHDTFRKSLELRRSAPEFVFYDGPPFATGLPHYGHLLAGTIKDIVPRYQTMRGRYVERRFGWDCHGLPVEVEVEQDLGIGGKTEIEKMGVGPFNEKCRSIVLRHTKEWESTVTRMGRWVNFRHDYKTMDSAYMESIWWVFKSLWDKGLVYKGHKSLWYCPRCATPLSNFETNQGYEEVSDPAITIRFKALDEEGAYFLAWTTTPWTLPSNMALAVGEDVVYVRVKEKDAVYYLAKARLQTYYKKPEEYESVTEVSGAELVGRSYEPLFPCFAARRQEGAFRVVSADFVSTEDGTGIVHVAPGFGEDDYRLALDKGIPVVCPIDAECRFTSEVPDYAGRAVKDTDADILARLKQEGKLVHRSTILHSYPHCWRCDTPLICRAVGTWFVRVERIKDRLIAANRRVNWMPDHLKDGRFGKWLEGARDWAISRNRYWGTPLPVWESEDGEERVCVGSIAELEALSGRRPADLHKHFVDEIAIPSRQGKKPLRRIPEVLDCWFESGAMPYAQAHYPFENRERFETHFPTDFIAEGLDQTRGWFYTLMVLSVALFDKPAFKNVVVNGLILAEDGKKMSKRLKNYPDPEHMINTYGADALRLYMIYSPVVRAESLRFSETGVKELLRHIFLPLWNAYSFFVTYANIDRWSPDGALKAKSSRNELDRWIRSALETLAADVTAAMDAYDLQRSVRPFVVFIENLTNWYIRRSRRRFWKSQDDADKKDAYLTLYCVLLQLAKVAAPFVPFLAESIYRNLRTPDMPESVHLCDFPAADGAGRDLRLEREMDVVQTVVKMGRQLRAEHELKVRQPLSLLRVLSRERETLESVRRHEDLILDELNVKRIAYDEDESRLADLQVKADFRRLGPRLGPRVKKAAAAIAAMNAGLVAQLVAGKPARLSVDGDPVELEPADVVVIRRPKEGLVVASEGSVVVALEMALTQDLIQEGLAREFVSKIQNMRKTADLEVTQRIRIRYASDAELAAAVTKHLGYVQAETLALECAREDSPPNGADQWDLNGHPCAIAMETATGQSREA